jgi:hypothetical protein
VVTCACGADLREVGTKEAPNKFVQFSRFLEDRLAGTFATEARNELRRPSEFETLTVNEILSIVRLFTNPGFATRKETAVGPKATPQFLRDATALQNFINAISNWPIGWEVHVKNCCDHYFRAKPATPALVLHHELLTTVFGFVNYPRARNAFGAIPSFICEQTKKCLRRRNLTVGDREFYASHRSESYWGNERTARFEYFPNLYLTDQESKTVCLSPKAAASVLGIGEYELPFLASELGLQPTDWMPVGALNTMLSRIYRSASIVSHNTPMDDFVSASHLSIFEKGTWKNLLPQVLKGKLDARIVKRAFPPSFEDIYVPRTAIPAIGRG